LLKEIIAAGLVASEPAFKFGQIAGEILRES
jgi:hypothetical protein